uniref:ER membrane protein complex subunit 1 n=1 Tax=Hirondellea gigas TaxID=1518452 RepID=A0A6A7FXR4_9CRUS
MAYLFLLIGFVLAPVYAQSSSDGHWSQQRVGYVEYAQFPPENQDNIIVGTREGVLAVLNSRTGKIVHRQVLPENSLDSLGDGNELFTLSGGILRFWKTIDLGLLWNSGNYAPPASTRHLSAHMKKIYELEHPSKSGSTKVSPSSVAFTSEGVILLSNGVVTYFNPVEDSVFLSWGEDEDSASSSIRRVGLAYSEQNSEIYVIGFKPRSSELTVWTLQLDFSGEMKGSPTKKVHHMKSLLGADNVFVMSKGFVIVLDPSSGSLEILDLFANNPSIQFFPSQLTGSSLRLESVPSSSRSIRRSQFVIQSRSASKVINIQRSKSSENLELYSFDAISNSAISSEVDENGQSVIVTASLSQDLLSIRAIDEFGSSKDLVEIPFSSDDHGEVVEIFMDSRRNTRFLVVCSDHSVSFIDDTKVLWTKEESLASIVDIQFMDVPIDYSKNEGDSEEAIVFPGFIQRTRGQLQSMLGLFMNFQQTGSQRDPFGFKKLIIVCTTAGKVFAVDTTQGDFIWSVFMNTEEIPRSMYITRKHSLPNDGNAEIAIFMRAGTQSGSLYYIDVMEGILSEIVPVPYQVLGKIFLPNMDPNHRRILVLIDSNLEGHVFPDTEEAREIVITQASTTYFYVTDIKTNLIEGYSLKEKDGHIYASSTWNLAFPEIERISDIAMRQEDDPIISATRELGGNRGVLQKYLNPNLLAIATEIDPNGLQPLSRRFASDPSIAVYLLDTVTGEIVGKSLHQNARGPISVIQSENLIVYQYWSDGNRPQKRKAIKNDITVLELFERYDGSSTFSSHLADRPNFFNQSFSLEDSVDVMSVTKTRLGVTSKNLLVGLSSSQVLSFDRMLLDTLRPLEGEPNIQASLPYAPVLPYSNDVNMISRDHEISKISNIISTSALVESTSLIVAWGLDLFFCRVMPSKTFDMLAPDFNHLLLALTVVIVFLAIFAIDYFQKKRTLDAQWA